jgi:hypothetical protein
MRPSFSVVVDTSGTGSGKELKKETKLGLSAKKGDDFGAWYSEVVVTSEMISYYDVSGCCYACLQGMCVICITFARAGQLITRIGSESFVKCLYPRAYCMQVATSCAPGHLPSGSTSRTGLMLKSGSSECRYVSSESKRLQFTCCASAHRLCPNMFQASG